MSTMGSPMSLDPPFEPDRFVCDRVVTQEARTGREVWQVTSGEGESVSPYMDCVAWSSDDRFLVVNCNRTGSWQPYRLEIDTGEMVQLCQVQLGAYRSVALAIGNDIAYCADGARVWAVELDTLAVREAVNWRPYFPPHTDTDIHPNFSRTGRMIAYNSDISGRSQVYVVPVGDIVQPGD